MNQPEIIFPLYRKYVGIDTWFKIVGKKEFIEIKRVGERYVLHHVIATQFPEFQLIQDMIDCYENRWEKIESNEYELNAGKIIS